MSKTFIQVTLIFLSTAYVVSPGPTSRNSFCFSVFLFFFFHSVSNFLCIQLANALVSGSGSDILLIQDIEPSLAEQCHTQNFYLRCFKSDFDAVKGRFGLLIE